MRVSEPFAEESILAAARRIDGLDDFGDEAFRAPMRVLLAALAEAPIHELGATRLYEDGTPRTKHVTTNAIIEVDDAAGNGSARSYYTVFQQTDELPLQPIICGRYHDTFHRLDGVWWFDTRIMFVDLVGDLSQHLLYALR